MEFKDTCSEESIMKEIAYIEKVHNQYVDLLNQLAKLTNQVRNEEDLLEHLQDAISSHIGENEIDISKFEDTNQVRINRWLVDW